MMVKQQPCKLLFHHHYYFNRYQPTRATGDFQSTTSCFSSDALTSINRWLLLPLYSKSSSRKDCTNGPSTNTSIYCNKVRV